MVEVLRNNSTETSAWMGGYPSLAGSSPDVSAVLDNQAKSLIRALKMRDATWHVEPMPVKFVSPSLSSAPRGWVILDTNLLCDVPMTFCHQRFGKIRNTINDLVISAGVGQLHLPAPTTSMTGWLASLDDIVADLGRLTPDWDGKNSALPSLKLISDLESALRILPSSTDTPDVDVDSSDGSVGLTWDDPNTGRHVAASFAGNGKIFLFVGCPDEGNWSGCVDVSDEVRILELFEKAFDKVAQPA